MARKGENIYKRKDGRWEGRYIVGRKVDGRARYASIYGKSYREVRDSLERKKGEQYRTKPNCSLTVKALMAMWLSLRSTEIKKSSYQHYLARIESQIIPRLGNIRISSLSAEMVSAFVKELLERGRLDGKGGLAPSTVSGIMSILRSAIRLAGKKYAIRDITLFDVKGPTVRQPKVATLCAAECETLARCIMAEPDLSGVAYLLALCCGPRLGELCGLKWSDIQFSESVLRINRTAIRIKDGDHTKLVVQPPKTEAALRPIPILNGILMLLVRLRGNAPDDAFILAGTEKPMEPRTLQKRFKRYLELHGLQHISFHGLRHTFATRSIDEGFDPKTLSEVLGHSNVKTTLQLYVHPSLSQKRRLVEGVSGFLPAAI
jgi:integrase